MTKADIVDQIAERTGLTKKDVAETVFDFWWSVYQGMSAWGGGWDKPPLLTHFGTSLVERASAPLIEPRPISETTWISP